MSKKWHIYGGSDSSTLVVSESDLLKAIAVGCGEQVEGWWLENFMGHLRRALDFKTHQDINLIELHNEVIRGASFNVQTHEGKKYSFGISHHQAEFEFDR